MIKDTHKAHPQGTVMAYADNASIIEGFDVERLYPEADGKWSYKAGADAHPDEGRDAQSPDGDLAVRGVRRLAPVARSVT